MLPLFSSLLQAVAGAIVIKTIPPGQSTVGVTITWNPPTKNRDGTPITGALTYNVYHSTQGGTLALLGKAFLAQYTSFIGPGTHLFAITSVESGIESDLSSQVSVTVLATTPNPPTWPTVK